MVLLLALLFGAPASAADDCFVTADKDIKDAEPTLFVRCGLVGQRLGISSGELEVPDEDGVTTTVPWEWTDSREVFRGRGTSGAITGGTVVVGVGATASEDGKVRPRRETCKFADYTVEGTYTQTCTVTLEGNASETTVTLRSWLDRKDRLVHRVVLEGETFTADEEAVVDVAVFDAEAKLVETTALPFRRSVASGVGTFVPASLDGASSDSSVWDGWTYTVTADDGTELLSETLDITPDIVEGELTAEFAREGEGVAITIRGRADRLQDVASVDISFFDTVDGEPFATFSPEITTIHRQGVALTGSGGDPLGQSWVITSTGLDEDGEVIAGPYRVTVTGVVGAEKSDRNITGGSLRDGIAWSVRGRGTRWDWTDWESTELIARTTVDAATWTHTVTPVGDRASIRLGEETFRLQRLRGALTESGTARVEALYSRVEAEDWDQTMIIQIDPTSSTGAPVSKPPPPKPDRWNDLDGDGEWDVTPYKWPT
jgi:hypothetical protein